MIARFVGLGQLLIPFDEVRAILIGPAEIKAIKLVEPALERPGGIVAGLSVLIFGTKMPFAHTIGAIARRFECLGQHLRIMRDFATVAGHVVGALIGRQVRHPHRLVVTARQQGGAGRRANRFAVEPVVPQPCCSERIDIGCTDFGAKGTQVGKANIIKNDQNDIGFCHRCRFGRGTGAGPTQSRSEHGCCQQQAFLHRSSSHQEQWRGGNSPPRLSIRTSRRGWPRSTDPHPC